MAADFERKAQHRRIRIPFPRRVDDVQVRSEPQWFTVVRADDPRRGNRGDDPGPIRRRGRDGVVLDELPLVAGFDDGLLRPLRQCRAPERGQRQGGCRGNMGQDGSVAAQGDTQRSTEWLGVTH